MNNVNIRVEKGEVLGIIGPNGAGKTTLFNLITGFLKPTSGKIIFEGREIQGLPPAKIVKLGIARTFQIVKPLKRLTVFQNVLIACGYKNYFGLSFMRGWRRDEYFRKAESIIRMVGLEDYAEIEAGLLPLGYQKRLELARALAVDPKLLLLDEPTAGMSYEESSEIKEIIKNIRRSGITIMLVEHNVPVAVELSDRMYVLNYGEIIAEGDPSSVIEDRRVVEAYLGVG